MRKGLPIGIIVCGALVLMASFLPWVTITGPLQIQGLGEANPFQSLAQAANHLFGREEISITVNAWNGNVSLAGLTLPNWLVVAAGLLITGVSILGSFPRTRVPSALLYSLWAYGTLHLCTLAVLLPSLKGEVHVGYVGTVITWIALLPLLIRDQASTPTQQENDPATPAGA